MKYIYFNIEDLSHFLYYKFRPFDEEELWVPFTEEPHVGGDDTLVFQFVDIPKRFIRLYGTVPILCVLEDSFNSRWEIRYLGTKINPMEEIFDSENELKKYVEGKA